MSKKFILTGQIVTKLMYIQRIDALELGQRLRKTRSNIYQLEKREFIKPKDTELILQALELTMEDVEKMDNDGLFNQEIPLQAPKALIEKPENAYLKDLVKNIEAHFATQNDFLKEQTKKHTEEIDFYRKQLSEKENQISILFEIIGKKAKESSLLFFCFAGRRKDV